MELVRKVRAFLSDPRRKAWWARQNAGKPVLLLRRGRLGAFLGYLVASATGWKVYDRYLEYLARRHGGTIEREIRGNRMELDLEDRGLSRDLFLYSVREHRGTAIFERELERIREEVDDGVVLEIGANIGYFALTELNALGDSAEVVAFEPDERNVSLLERNLELNDYRDATTIERAAVGPECDTAELELSDHSNLNRVRTETTGDWEYGSGESVTVDMWSIDEYLDSRDRSPDSVVAVRMDVEGYEVDVLQGMERVLAADGPLILSIEVHTGLLESHEVRRLLDRLDDHGFEVVEALTEEITIEPFGDVRDVDDIQSLPDSGPAYNLVLEKSAPSGECPSDSLETELPTAD